MAAATIVIALIAGFVSFLSPCVLPLIPGFLAYLSGTAQGAKNARFQTFLNSVFFVLGFSFVFAIVGVLLNTVLEQVSHDAQAWLARAGGIVIILFGFYVLGFIKIPFLEREHKFAVRKKFSITYVTSFVFGAAFAAGWTPCVSAVLGSILMLAVTSPGQSFMLLLFYGIGLGIPFLLVGLFGTEALALINKSTTFLKYFNIIVGMLLITLGVLVFTGELNVVANLFFT